MVLLCMCGVGGARGLQMGRCAMCRYKCANGAGQVAASRLRFIPSSGHNGIANLFIAFIAPNNKEKFKFVNFLYELCALRELRES